MTDTVGMLRACAAFKRATLQETLSIASIRIDGFGDRN